MICTYRIIIELLDQNCNSPIAQAYAYGCAYAYIVTVLQPPMKFW